MLLSKVVKDKKAALYIEPKEDAEIIVCSHLQICHADKCSRFFPETETSSEERNSKNQPQEQIPKTNFEAMKIGEFQNSPDNPKIITPVPTSPKSHR